MDSKEIKVHLKEAREAIRVKDYKEALKHCENVLKLDEKNYSALVFTGVSNQEVGEHDEAAKAFKKAIEIAPHQILAWQGWCSFCEKSSNPNYKSELLNAYSKVIELHNDKNKQFEIAGKLAHLYLGMKELEKSVETLERQLEFCFGNEEKEKQVHASTVNILASLTTLSPELEHSLQTSLSKLLSSSHLTDNEEIRHFSEINIKMLLKANKSSQALKEARKLLTVDDNSIFAHEVICSSFVKSVVENETLSVDEMKSIVERLLGLDPNNRIAKVANIALCLATKNLQTLMLHLSQINSGSSIDECLLLLRCCNSVHQYQNSLRFSEQGLKLCKKSNENKQTEKSVLFEIGVINAELHTSLNDVIEKNVISLEKLVQTNNNIELCELLMKSLLKIGNLEKARKLANTLSENDSFRNLMEGYLGSILRLEGELEEAKQKLENALKFHPVHSYFSLELGLVLRELKHHSKSLMYFLTALKEDPYNSQLFLQLGHHYKSTNNNEKASRCYKKAYQLNSQDEEICVALSDVYRQTGQNAENYHLLKSVTDGVLARSWKWAWLRLGLHEYHTNNLTEAVKALQSALRIDPKDSHCWETLADIYTARGSYTAALKSYTRSLELNPESIYCCYQMAKIRQLLQEYSQAITEYKAVLSKDMNYIPAMKGYGEAKILQASFYLRQCLHGMAKECCDEAIEMLSSAIFLQPDLICLWKLLGDACTFSRNFPSDIYKFKISNKLALVCGYQNTLCDRKQMLHLGVRCYGKALSIQESAGLWHDVGLNYHYQAQYSDDTAVKTENYEKAITSLKKAVILSSQNGCHWNSLGVVASRLKKFDLAQHAFITAVQCEENNVVSWTNLGVVYLLNDNIQLANQAFSVSQSIEPTYINCWIGQAIIAEQVGHADAMDLFRHTTSLDNHEESAIGYAHWTISTLLSMNAEKNSELYNYWMEQLAAVPTASDCMIRYTGHVTNDAQSLNMLGLLLEKQNLKRGAKVAFEKALELLKSDDLDTRDSVRSNYGRLLTSMNKYDEAIKQFELVKKPDFSSQCGLGLCYFKNGNFDDSFQAYEAALHWFSTNDEEKAHVLVAMAGVAYKLNKVDGVKALLFQSSQLEPPSIPGILALCAVGLLQTDLTLVQVTLKELMAYAKNPSYMNSITFLIASTVLLQGKNNLGQRILSKALHEFPWQQDLWSMMGQTLLQFQCSGSKVADKCASNAVVLARNSVQRKTASSSVYEIATLVMLCQLANGNGMNCLKNAQKTIHLNPSSISNWSGLLSAVVAKDGCYKRTMEKLWFNRLLGFAIDQVAVAQDRELYCWLLWYRCLVHLSVDNVNEAARSLRKAIDCNSQQPRSIAITKVLQEILSIQTSTNKTTVNLQQCLAGNPNFTFGWQTLVKILLSEGSYLKAKECIEKWRFLAEKLALPNVVFFALILFINLTLELNDGQALGEAEKALKDATEFGDGRNVLYFLTAKLHQKQKDPKKVKRYLKLVLTCSNDGPTESWTRMLAKKMLGTEK